MMQTISASVKTQSSPRKTIAGRSLGKEIAERRSVEEIVEVIRKKKSPEEKIAIKKITEREDRWKRRFKDGQ